MVLPDEPRNRRPFADTRVQPAERRREKGQIGRCVVEKRGEDSARPEEMARRAHRAHDEGHRPVLAGAQHDERGNDRREDGGEQDRDLADRRPGVLVLLTDARRGREPRAREHRDQDGVARQVLHLLVHAEDGHLTGRPDAGQDHCADHAAQEDEVVPALDGERLARSLGRLANHPVLAPPVIDVLERVDAEHHQRHQRRLLPQRERPEERHPVQEPQEERRVAEWREGAADVRHQEDEEHDRMRPVPARAVGA